MAYHSISNWLGEPTRIFIPNDPDEVLERLRDDLESENARYAAQMKLFPRAEQGAQREGAA